MDRTDAFEKVTRIARDVFENDTIVLTDATTAADVEEWDSLAHLSLVSDIEAEFDIKFTLSEITDLQNIGELIDAILKHVHKK